MSWLTASSATPAVDTAIYASGDLIGTMLTFKNVTRTAGRGGEIIDAILTDLAKQSAVIDLILFDADPTNTTFTDQAAFDSADADMPKAIGAIEFLTYYGLNDNSFASETAIGMGFLPANAAPTTIYGALVSRGTPTFAAATDVTVRLKIKQY